jgi:hypothetical protein
MANLTKWQKILNLEAQAKGLPIPYPSGTGETSTDLGALPNPEHLTSSARQPSIPTESATKQIARDVRLARNIGLAFLLGRVVPGLLVLWAVWAIFGR